MQLSDFVVKNKDDTSTREIRIIIAANTEQAYDSVPNTKRK